MNPGDKVTVFGQHHGVVKKPAAKHLARPDSVPVQWKDAGTTYLANVALTDLTLVGAEPPKEPPCKPPPDPDSASFSSW